MTLRSLYMPGFYFSDNDHSSGADPGFFLGGGALFSTQFFFFAEYQLQKTAGHLRGGGGAHPLHPPPRSAPALDVKILGFKTTVQKSLHNAILWSRFSGIAKGGTLPGFPEPPLGYSMGYNFKRNEILAVKENEKKIN